MFLIDNILQVCDSIAGIKSIAVTDPSNVNGNGSILNSSQAFLIYPRVRTGRLKEKSSKTEAGEYVEASLSFYVPKRRAETIKFITRSADRYIACQFTNQYNDVITLLRCRVSIDFDSGTRISEDEGYTITITHVYATATPDLLPSGIATPANNNPNTGIVGDGGGASEGGGLATPPTAGCANFATSISKSGNTLSPDISGMPDNLEPLQYYWFKDGDLLGISETITTTGPGTYSLIVEKYPCRTPEAFLIVRSQCELLVILPYQTGNTINANIENPPPDYTVQVKDSEGTVIGTSIPHEVTESGDYFIYIIGEDCERNAGITVNIVLCDYTVEIDDETTPGELAFTTDAPSGYTWEWEFEDAEGVTSLTTEDLTIVPDRSGIYRIKVFSETCTKSAYHIHIADDFARLFEAHYDFSGTVLTLKNIDLKKITNPDTQLLVRIGFDVATHTQSLSAEFQYTINRTANTITFWSGIPLSNENVYINEL